MYKSKISKKFLATLLSVCMLGGAVSLRTVHYVSADETSSETETETVGTSSDNLASESNEESEKSEKLSSSTDSVESSTQANSNEEKAIFEIQGENYESPLVGQTVITSGIVTAVWNGRKSLVIQTPSADVPENFKGSSALKIVFAQDSALSECTIGDKVKIEGIVEELDTATILKDAKILEKTESDISLINIPKMSVPKTKEEQESFEFMLFQPADKYRVNGTDMLHMNGQITLSDGDKPLLQPTQVGLPGSDEAKAQVEYNDMHRVVLDDANDDYFDVKFGQEITPVPPEAFPYLNPDKKSPQLSAEATFSKPMILSVVEAKYVLDPQETIVGYDEDKNGVSFSDVREEAPAELSGNFKIASFNVLNYFADLGSACELSSEDGKKLCEASMNLYDGTVPVSGNWDCPARGAWDEDGLKRQEDKIVNAINKLGDAGVSIVALQEIENGSQFNQDIDIALDQLVAALNKQAGQEIWSKVPAPKTMPKYGNDDKIRQTFIYKSSEVELVGESFYIDDEAYQSAADARAPLGQIFKDKNTGKTLLLFNNHLTYKGGKVVGDDNKNPGDELGLAHDVGRNNGDRERQAVALIEAVSEKVSAGLADFAVLMGDMNNYSYESPIQKFTEAGFIDLMNTNEYPSKHSASDWNEYSYSYNAMLGSLDHVLLSAEAKDSFNDFDIWTSNAYSSKAFEYSRFGASGTNYYYDDVFRASDHNAVVVSFNLT